MLFNRKLKAIKKNILANGGATYKSNLQVANYQRGYMVSLAGYEKTLKIENLKMRTIKKYQKTAKALNCCVGFWIENDLLYLDISKHFVSKEKAVKQAEKSGQLALYDIYHKKSVYLKDITCDYKRVWKKTYNF